MDPELGRIDLEDLEGGASRLVTDAAVRRGRTGDGVAFKTDDVLFAKLRPYLRKSMLCAGPGCCSPELVVMSPNPALVEPRFVGYLVRSEPFIGWAVATSKGVKMPRTSFEALGEFPVELHDRNFQRQIADFLDRETTKVNRLLDGRRRMFHLVRERYQALNASLVYAPGDEDFELVPLMHLVDDTRPVMYGIVLPGPDVPDGVLLVKGGDVEAGRMTPEMLNRTAPEIEAPHARSRLKEGDLLVSIRGSFGAVAEVPAGLTGANITQDAARVAPADGVNARWLLHALRSDFVYGQLASRATGATVRGVNIRDLKRVMVPVPPPRRQDAIADELDRAMGVTERLRERLHRQVGLLDMRRRSLITAAVSGELETVERESVAA